MSGIKRKHNYTTGDVARITGLSCRTIAKSIDSGELRGFRIPGGKVRRVPHSVLMEFLTTLVMDVPCQLQAELSHERTRNAGS